MNYQAPQIKWIEATDKDQHENYPKLICSCKTPVKTYSIRENLDTRSKKPYVVIYQGKFAEFATVDEAKEWVEQTHYPSALIKAGFKPVSEPLADMLKWFELAVPEPTDKNLAVQIGCFYEEVAEVATALQDDAISQKLRVVADAYKQNQRDVYIADKNELLDGLCDVKVTAIGIGYMAGFKAIDALNEVNRSNFSKFENGKPVFDDNGKIKKGANYTPPQLQEFI